METQIQHRTSELQATQSSLDTLKEVIDKRTESLLKAQEKRLQDAADLLNANLEDLKSRIEAQQKIISENIKAIDQLSEEKRAAEEARQVVKATSDETLRILAHNLSEVEQAKQDGVVLEQQKTALQAEYSHLEQQKPALESEITDLEAKKAQLIQVTADLDTLYSQKTVEKEKGLNLLDAKVLEASQKVQTAQAELQLMRDDYATMQKLMDERDRNLRIRESKVELGEGKLVSNSALLEL